MENDTHDSIARLAAETDDPLTTLLRRGARDLLLQGLSVL